MDRIDDLLSVLDFMMNTKRKRHIVGGILLSTALLFAGLSLTVITIKDENKEDDNELQII